MINPTIHDALRALGCEGGWKIKNGEISGWTCKTPQPSDKAIQAKLKELEDEYEKQAYARSRAKAYDPIPEQLDQIYHDMDGWKAKIKAVKDKYPKPE